MVFKKGQTIYFIYRVKATNKNKHNWKVRSGIVLNDNGISSEIEIKPTRKPPHKVNRKYIFSDMKDAESKCEYYNHWGKYHKNIQYRGRKKKI